MRRAVILTCLTLAAPVAAQQATEAPGFFDRLFGTDNADNDAEQGSLLERLIEDQLSDAGRTVTVEGFSGALSGKASLDRLSISDETGVWLTLEDAVLDWNRSALFGGRLEVAELTAARIDLPRLAEPSAESAPTPEASGFSLPELPVSIEIGRIAAEEVQIGAPVFGAEANVAIDGAFSLIDGEGAAELSVERRGADGALTLEAAFANATRNLSVDLSLQEAPDGIFANLVDLPGLPSVDFSITGDAPLSDFAADIRLSTDGAPRLDGQITLQETDDDTRRISADIGGDIAPVFAPDYRPFFGDAIRLKADTVIAADGTISVPEFALTAEALSLSGVLELGADRLPRTFAVEGQIAAEDRTPVLLPLSGIETRIDRADLALSFDAAQSEDWTGEISLAGLDRDGLTVELVVLNGAGRIAAGSSPDVTASFQFNALQLETGIAGVTELLGSNVRGKTSIKWQNGPIQIEELELSARSLSATGNAEIALVETGPQILGEISLTAARVADFSTLANRALSGAAELATTFRVEPLGGVFDVRAIGQTTDLTIDDPRANAVLAGVAELDVQATRDENGLRVELAKLASDAADLTAKANLMSGGSDVTLKGTLKDTGLLIKSLSGPSKISLIGREDANRDWDILASVDGPTFKTALDGKFSDLFGLPAFSGDIQASADELSVFSDLAERPLRGRLSVNATGRVVSDLSDVTINADVNGAGLSIGQAEADRLLAGTLAAKLDASKTVDAIDIAGLEISTDLLTATASGVLADRDTELAINAKLGEIAGFVEGLSGPVSLDGTVGRDGEDVRVNLSAIGPGGAQADVAGTVADTFASANLTARGSAPLGLANRFIQPRNVAGTAGFDLRISGPLALESVSGNVSTSGARLTAPTAGIALNDITAEIALNNGSANVVLQAAVSNGGRIAINGPVGLTAPNPANLQIDLTRIALSDPRLYETTVDGRIGVNGPLAGGASITGALELGQTDIRIPDSGFGGAGDVPEIIHLNEPPPVRGTRRRAGLLTQSSAEQGNSSGAAYPLNIRVNAPNRIFVRGRGLDSEFGGGLQLTGSTANVIPLGAFELIRGRLDILGRRLLLEEARITLQGGFIPFLNLRASTEAEEYQINVIVEGPVDNPQITFTASPDLPQEEVLSRLIFGRGLETLSPLQAARLALAVRTLAGQGGEGIVGRIRGQTGLADLDVTTTEDGNAAVRAGAYLGENIYSDVTVDSTGETELNLNLDITPSFTARGGVTSEGETSLGIFFERDY